MQFGDLKTRVRDSIASEIGDLDDEIDRWSKDAIDDVASHARWGWDLKSGTFLARGRLQGTATWTLGQASIVLNTGGAASAALAAEFVNGLVRIGSNMYVVTAYVHATQTLTTATEIIDANGAAAAFTFIQDMNTLPAVVDEVVSVKDQLTPRPIVLLDGHQRRRLYPDPFVQLGAVPRWAWVRGVDALGNKELGLYPPPVSDRVYFFEYYRNHSQPTGDTDELEAVTGIPKRFHPTILARAKIKAFEYERENGETRSRVEAEYLLGLRDMMKYRSANEAGAVKQVASDLDTRRGLFFDNPDIKEPT